MDIAPKYIIAGNYNEYRLYVRDHYFDGIIYKWVSNVDSIRGLNDISGVFIGTWADRDDIVNIIQQIHNIKSRINNWNMPFEIAEVYTKKLIEESMIAAGIRFINPVTPVNNITVPANHIKFGTTISGIWMDEFANTDTSRSI